MTGGNGHDVYMVNNKGDKVRENANGGQDLIKASINYNLGKNQENLSLTGKKSINGTGNNLDNEEIMPKIVSRVMGVMML